MYRIKCEFSYDGTRYKGYQKQIDELTIQGEIEKILSSIFDEDIKFVSSGRTDLGVHALYQVGHFDVSRLEDLPHLLNALNRLLPKDIHFSSLSYVDESFHARISALKKTYEYKINIGEENPFYTHYKHQLNQEVDFALMEKCLALFIGEKNFKNFTTKKEDYQGFIRTIYDFAIIKDNQEITFRITGSGFMKHMVRMIVGTIVDIGLHRIDISYIEEAFTSLETPVNHLVPGCGLYLVDVIYEGSDIDDSI